MGQIIGTPGGGTLTAYYPGDTQSGSPVQNTGDWWGSNAMSPWAQGGSAWGNMGGSYGSSPTSTTTGTNNGSSSGSTSGSMTDTHNTTNTPIDPALWAAFTGGLQGAIAHPGTPDSVTQGIINKGTDQLSDAQKASALSLDQRAQAYGGGQSGGLQKALGQLDASYAGQKSNLARDVQLAADQTRQDRLLQALNIASHQPLNQNQTGSQQNQGTSNNTTTNNYTTTAPAPASYGSYGGASGSSYGKASGAMGFGNMGAFSPAMQTPRNNTSAAFPQGYMAMTGKSGGNGYGDDQPFGTGMGGSNQFQWDTGPDANANSWGQLTGGRTTW